MILVGILHIGNASISGETFWEICFSQNGVLVNFTKKMTQDIYRITSCYNSMTQIAELDIFTGTGIKFEAMPPSWRTRTWLNLYGASRFQSLNRKQVVFVICIFYLNRSPILVVYVKRSPVLVFYVKRSPVLSRLFCKQELLPQVALVLPCKIKILRHMSNICKVIYAAQFVPC